MVALVGIPTGTPTNESGPRHGCGAPVENTERLDWIVRGVIGGAG
jgi:hypothetical protein